MKTIMRLMFAAATLATTMCFDVPASHAFGDAPWCVVKDIDGGAYLDCQYRTFEECYPNALADRGFCNLNPWPGPSTPNTAAHSRQQRQMRQH